ncbi:MAG: hypothetical protein ACLFRZ_12455, partial [Rhodosalinus sp.]
AMFRVAEIRRARISGTMDNHERTVGTDWVVVAQGERFELRIEADRQGSTIRFAEGDAHRVTSNWTPGQSLARLALDGEPLVLKVGKSPNGFRIRTRGADMKVAVYTPRQAELAALMPGAPLAQPAGFVRNAGGGMAVPLLASGLMLAAAVAPGRRWRWIDALHLLWLAALLGFWAYATWA